VDGGKSAPPLPDGLPDQDNVAEDEIMPAKSAPPPVGMPKGSEDEGDEEMPAKSAPSSGLDLQKSDTSPRAATPSQEIAALIATAADAELPPSVLSESASFARHFKLMQEKAGLPVVQSPPRSAPPKWRPSPSGKFTERQGSASSAPPQREVMGLLSRMSIRQEIRGEALVVVDPFAQETWKHDRDSLPEESSQPIPVRKVQKQKTWNDSTVASHNFTFDDDEESDEFPEFPEPDEDVDEIAETAEESFVEAQATPQATPARERSRSSSSTEQVFASTSMGSEEQDARDSFASHGERRDRDKLPKIETGLRRSHTAPSGPLAEDDPNIGAHFQDLQKKLRDELAMHEQTRVHAQELERKLKLANAKLTSPPKVKNQHRFGVTAPVPYVAPPLPIRKKREEGCLPAGSEDAEASFPEEGCRRCSPSSGAGPAGHTENVSHVSSRSVSFQGRGFQQAWSSGDEHLGRSKNREGLTVPGHDSFLRFDVGLFQRVERHSQLLGMRSSDQLFAELGMMLISSSKRVETSCCD